MPPLAIEGKPILVRYPALRLKRNKPEFMQYQIAIITRHLDATYHSITVQRTSIHLLQQGSVPNCLDVLLKVNASHYNFRCRTLQAELQWRSPHRRWCVELPGQICMSMLDKFPFQAELSREKNCRADDIDKCTSSPNQLLAAVDRYTLSTLQAVRFLRTDALSDPPWQGQGW